MSFVYGFMERCLGDVGNGSDGTGHEYMRTDCIYTRIMMTRWAVDGDGWMGTGTDT